MKHSIIIFLSIAVTLATASCSKSDKNTEDSASASVEAVSSAAPAEQEETSSAQNAETSAAEQSQPAEEVTQAKNISLAYANFLRRHILSSNFQFVASISSN